jgi:hypothetical protein
MRREMRNQSLNADQFFLWRAKAGRLREASGGKGAKQGGGERESRHCVRTCPPIGRRCLLDTYRSVRCDSTIVVSGLGEAIGN